MNESNFEILTNLLKSDDCKLINVLGRNDFTQAIRSELNIVLEFLSKETTIKELCEWCFSINKMNDEYYNHYSISSMNIFTSSVPKLFIIFLRNKSFAEYLYNFLISNNSDNPRLCGHFLRVLSQQIRWGNSLFFSTYTDIDKYLILKIKNLAIQELIVLIASKSSYNLFKNQNLILNLSKKSLIKDEFQYPSISLLIQLYDTLGDESPILSEYLNSEVIKNLFEICCTINSNLISTDIMNIIIDLLEFGIDLSHYLNKWNNFLTITKNNINPLTVSAISITKPHFLNLFSLFFEENSCHYLHHFLSQLILQLQISDLEELIKFPNFINKIINSFNTKDWCPHLLQITIILHRTFNDNKNLKTNEWILFINKKINPKLEILEKNYGGQIPEINNEYNTSTTSSSSDDNYYTEEEEINIGLNDEMDYSNSDED